MAAISSNIIVIQCLVEIGKTKGVALIERQHKDVRYLQFEQYQRFPQLIHGVFTREGGLSKGPFASLNAAYTQGDEIEAVIQNRQKALRALGVYGLPSISLWQVHGAEVHSVDTSGEWRMDWSELSAYEQRFIPPIVRKGDGMITQEQSLVLALAFADCVPITFYDPERQVIGMAHGGWRGTARGIVMATVESMQERFGSQPHDIMAGIGPAIRACCYEVSQQLQEIFLGRQEFESEPTRAEYRGRVRESACFSTIRVADGESLRLDLQETNRNQLLMAGLVPEHIEVMPICTSCHTEWFFSHRKEQGRTGRFMVIMALDTKNGK